MDLFQQACRQFEAEPDGQQFMEDTELIRNHYLHRWWLHERRVQAQGNPRRGPPVTMEEAQTLANKVAFLINRAWYQELHLLRRGEPMRPCGCLDMTDAETSDSDNQDDAHDQRDRSRSPTPMRATSSTALEPPSRNHPQIVLDDSDTSIDTEADFASLMSGKAKDVPVHKRSPTRLWRELPPDRKTSSVRTLRPPWKKGNNPPLQARPPPTPPTRKPTPKQRPASARCSAEVPAPKTPEAEQAEGEAATAEMQAEDTEMTKDDMMAVWQALFDMQPSDSLSPSSSPLLPAHIADNVVETLVDYPEHHHNAMADALPEFMARLQLDAAAALQRARSLRGRLQTEEGTVPSQPSAPSDRPAPAYEEEEEEEESIYMQTNVQEITAPTKEDPRATKKPILQMLQDAFNKLPEDDTTSRALQLMNRLQEHDGPLQVDRQALEALLVSVSGDVPPAATGEAIIVEHAWVATWWGRLVGNRNATLQDIDKNIEDWDREISAVDMIRQADEDEKAQEEARYQAYLQYLEEARQDHTDRLKTPNEDHDVMAAAAGLSYEPTKTRLCVGLCWDDGTSSRAWEWELDRGATLQLHIKMEKKDYPGGWMKNGKRLPEDQVPACLRETQPKAKCRPTPKPLPQLDLNRPATRELFSRWQAGKVSDTTVVQVGSPTMLKFFREMTDIPRDVLEALDERDTMDVSRPRDPGDMPASASHMPPTLPVPESEIETIPVDQAETGENQLNEGNMIHGEMEQANAEADHPDDDSDIQSNPDPYFNGRKYYEKYGHDGHDDYGDSE
ncbi:unnamed protein product [Symbiodinium sp. CCMP2592]|nr:unnamed protein product [Symbiodinium sp. CCMP2592]